MKKRLQKLIVPVICAAMIGLMAALLPRILASDVRVPSLTGQDRTLLRIWMVSSPGGGQAWLKQQLRQFEKQHPGVSTWLRIISADGMTEPDTVLPDVILYMPGDVLDPGELFLPLSGDMTDTDNGLIRPELLRCGRWRSQQYALPLCWSTWALAIDSSFEAGTAFTPAPTTLLGKPAASSVTATPEPDYPLAAISQSACALQSPGGAALFTLGLLLEERPPLPENFASLPASDVYAAFQRKQCASAMLTMGQVTAFSGLVSGGSGFPFRVMLPDEVITDQVWLASITASAPAEAALLLAHLTSTDAQKALFAQGLHTVRSNLTLYASGPSHRVEHAAQQALSALNAYLPADQIQAAAWQYFQGRLDLSEALLPLL